jgi:hypothetical protein
VRTVDGLLRDTFAEQVKSAPVLDDPATTAIRCARRARQRRHLASGLASMLTLVLLAGGMMSMRDFWQEPTTHTGVTSPVLPPPEPVTQEPEPWQGSVLGVEVRLVNRVWTADGERVLLSGAGLVTQAYRTPYGLIYGNDEEVSLRLDDGSVTALAKDAGRWRVSPDGQWIVLVADRTARVAPLEAGGLGAVMQAQVPEGTVPVAFWGERVVLAGPDGQGYDVWDPATPDYEPSWTDQVAAVYGEAGADLVVLVPDSDRYCLAVVSGDADSLNPDGVGACDRPVPVTDQPPRGWLSPDGRWLAAPVDDGLRLFEVPVPDGADAQAMTCPWREHVAPVWLDSTTLVTADDIGAFSCRVDGAVEQLSLPDRLGSRWEFVPVLGTLG